MKLVDTKNQILPRRAVKYKPPPPITVKNVSPNPRTSNPTTLFYIPKSVAELQLMKVLMKFSFFILIKYSISFDRERVI